MNHDKKLFLLKIALLDHPILQDAHNQQKQAISSYISTLTERLVAKEQDSNLNAHWSNESEVKDNKIFSYLV